MQLFHFDRAPNYGDSLNPWLWPRLLGDRLQSSSPTLFLGIGTVLKTDLPEAEGYAVLGSGGGYGPFPLPDHRWRIYAVRGPLTAKHLGLDPRVAAVDGAYLLRRFPLPPAAATGLRIGFMPHWQTRLRVPWEKICRLSGLRYISPTLPVEEALAEFQACDAIVAEAMHAAITADALRIPWVPVRLGGQFLDFKWRDWLGSVDLKCSPLPLQSIHPRVEEKADEGVFHRCYRKAVNATTYAFQTRTLVGQLNELRRHLEYNPSAGFLSNLQTLNHRCDRLDNALKRLCENET